MVLRTLPCAHQFHDACILSWLQRNTTCPLCKHVVYERKERASSRSYENETLGSSAGSGFDRLGGATSGPSSQGGDDAIPGGLEVEDVSDGNASTQADATNRFPVTLPGSTAVHETNATRTS